MFIPKIYKPFFPYFDTMVESHKAHKKNDIWKRILIVWAFISILTIFVMYSVIKSQISSYESMRDSYKEFQFVPEGSQGFYCEKGQSYTCYDKNEYAMVYDPKTDSVVKCNALKNEQATCLGSTQQVSYCSSDQYSICVDKDKPYTTCGVGEVATCHTKGLYAIFTGHNSYSCNAGEVAWCQTK